jgi:uncharacterized membrane protein
MDSYWLDFAGMLVRWLHVIAGIAWIGSSFYFIWLDRSLEPPEPGSEEEKKGVGGHLWAVHGGGFYNPQKYTVAPARLPEKLHWFKWEAYTTWLSGTAMLVLVYWLHAGTMMLDPGKSALMPWQAVALGAGETTGSWARSCSFSSSRSRGASRFGSADEPSTCTSEPASARSWRRTSFS